MALPAMLARIKLSGGYHLVRQSEIVICAGSDWSVTQGSRPMIFKL
jgi:hypothetical protein